VAVLLIFQSTAKTSGNKADDGMPIDSLWTM